MARKVDELGRIVLPVEMRRLFGIRPGDALEIAVDDAGIVLRKLETRCVFCGGNDGLRAHLDKQVCGSCVMELGMPVETGGFLSSPEPERDVVDAPAGQG